MARGELPPGVADLFFAAAEQKLALEATLRDQFARWGYRPVIPPAFEYAGTLASEAGVRLAEEMYRFSVELSPLVGLADLLVDMVETGRTLRENGLAELRTIMHSQAALIANRAAYTLKAEAMTALIDNLRRAMRESGQQSAFSDQRSLGSELKADG